MSVACPVEAFALRPVRVDEKNNQFINYEGTTFPNDPFGGCELWLRRCAALGFVVADSEVAVDVLDRDGSILETRYLSKAGFEYLRRSLKFKREASAR